MILAEVLSEPQGALRQSLFHLGLENNAIGSEGAASLVAAVREAAATRLVGVVVNSATGARTPRQNMNRGGSRASGRKSTDESTTTTTTETVRRRAAVPTSAIAPVAPPSPGFVLDLEFNNIERLDRGRDGVDGGASAPTEELFELRLAGNPISNRLLPVSQ